MVQVRGVRRQPAYAGAAPKMLILGHPSFSSPADCSSTERLASTRYQRQRRGASVLRPKARKAEWSRPPYAQEGSKVMAIRPYGHAFERPMHLKTYVKETKCKARQLYWSRILFYGGRRLGVADLPSGNVTILPAILECVRSGSVSRFNLMPAMFVACLSRLALVSEAMCVVVIHVHF